MSQFIPSGLDAPVGIRNNDSVFISCQLLTCPIVRCGCKIGFVEEFCIYSQKKNEPFNTNNKTIMTLCKYVWGNVFFAGCIILHVSYTSVSVPIEGSYK